MLSFSEDVRFVVIMPEEYSVVGDLLRKISHPIGVELPLENGGSHPPPSPSKSKKTSIIEVAPASFTKMLGSATGLFRYIPEDSLSIKVKICCEIGDHLQILI